MVAMKETQIFAKLRDKTNLMNKCVYEVYVILQFATLTHKKIQQAKKEKKKFSSLSLLITKHII